MTQETLQPEFIKNAAAQSTTSSFIEVRVDVARILKSWRESVFSFEWLDEDGGIKKPDELSRREQPKREAVEKKLASGAPIEMPILGIGLQDHVEIGSGRDVFLTLAAHGHKVLPVHIPKSNEKDFQKYLAGFSGP
jgi:hypothetical protein